MSEQTEAHAGVKNLLTFYEEFVNESDRASVILAVAMFDEALGVLLRNSLVSISTGQDPLFDGPYAPLSTFSAKIEMAFRIGLISRRMSRSLHLIRKIRNDFAHNITGCSFENASVRSRMVELFNGYSEEISKYEDVELPGITEKFRKDFMIVVSWLLLRLWVKAEGAEALPPAQRMKREKGPGAKWAPPWLDS